jgi:hypothetical protein
VAIDFQAEELLSLRDAARLLPPRRKGKRPHVSCLYRWTTAGCKGIVLESVNVGGTRCTSREALARFIERLSAANGTGQGGQTPCGRRRDLAQVERELDQKGIK